MKKKLLTLTLAFKDSISAPFVLDSIGEVLVAERIGYVDRAKEVIYESLTAAGITIPFPQCDVHLIHEG